MPLNCGVYKLLYAVFYLFLWGHELANSLLLLRVLRSLLQMITDDKLVVIPDFVKCFLVRGDCFVENSNSSLMSYWLASY